MSLIKVYPKNSMEYKKLELFASMCDDKFDEKGIDCFVTIETTYFDFGQDWKYTALITNEATSSYQSLCPRDYENILLCDSISELDRYAEIYTSKAWNDWKVNVTF